MDSSSSSTSTSTRGLHAIPRSERPKLSPTSAILSKTRTLIFNLFFFLFAVLLSTILHLTALPLRLIPITFSQRLSLKVAAWGKEAFASLLVAVQRFGPSQLCITADDSIVLEQVLKRDQKGKVVGFKFNERSIWIANHQQYADWIYIWIVFSMGSIASGLCIILKASLQWAPIVGPAMQLFSFAFIDKKKTLQNAGIYQFAKRSLEAKMPFALLVFPEATLVSRLTRPKSQAFAEANGVADLRNTLLPRSTGLLYCLRTLLSIMPDLTLYDLTIGYSGVPDLGYAQDYFTLQSVFGQGIPPPTVHLHLRSLDLSKVPLGNIRETNPDVLDKELTVEERAVFQEWTRMRWVEKDELMTGFYEKGEFPVGKQGCVMLEVGMRKRDWAMLASLPVMVWMVFVGARWAWRMM